MKNLNTELIAESSPHPAKSHYAIPQLEVPVIFDRHIIAVFPYSTTAKEWWISAGWMEQNIFTGVLVGGNPDVRALESQRLLLNRINLAIFPKLTSTYQLNIDIPYWFRDYKVTIWIYTGIEEDSTEQLIENNEALLLQIKQVVDEINTKI
ncbi:hypothetical protein [Okeania sp. SIO2B3]|uniref:hypothetical protein n=1 Tax=Okeania sp. SIO2B3 TaxID=2607784 RepID=UPI0013BF25C2|nr:hypothetical protein [Okeania sp. SIO2B3]NET46198.1 hypothetical protein [Okeania sp. SIO2B3]